MVARVLLVAEPTGIVTSDFVTVTVPLFAETLVTIGPVPDSTTFVDVNLSCFVASIWLYAPSTYDAAATTGKHLWEIKNNNTDGTAKYVYQDGKRVAYKGATKCTGTDTILVFKGSYISYLDYTQNGGMKLYSIKMYNKNGKLLHDYQPVAKGTDICGTVVPANAMYDFVDKKVYLPAGTGQMGYGVDS